MTIDIAKVLVYNPDDPVSFERRVWDMVVQEGRAVYLVGLPYSKCPPFKNEDMAISWRMGWRHEHVDHYKHDPRVASKRCHLGCEHE